jgi:hypothetical protein
MFSGAYAMSMKVSDREVTHFQISKVRLEILYQITGIAGPTYTCGNSRIYLTNEYLKCQAMQYLAMQY